MTIAIIGSGPAGVATAYCLLRKGLPVTMLDVGYRLEPERQQLVARLAAAKPEQWDDDSLSALREPMEPDVKGLPRKLIYGSDYPYRAPSELVQYESRGVDLLISHALGGLSNTWGSNVWPFQELDISDWPIRATDLAEYYRAVFSFVDLSAREDRLQDRFPLYTDTPRPLRMSRQAQALLDDLERHHEVLSRNGFEYGSSRLAVRTEPRNGDAGCIYCGLCLYGCPYGLIYSSAHSLAELQSFRNFQYLPGYYVERVQEQGKVVDIDARRVSGGQPERFFAERVFLGCGAASTTKIVLESLGELGREVLLRDSQYFLTPMLRYRGVPHVAQEPLHTLSQVCLELIDPLVSPRSIHLLVYTYNDLYRRALKKLCGPLFGPLRPLVDHVLARMLIIQGYLHSDDSPSIAMRVERSRGSAQARVVLETRPNRRTTPVIQGVLNRLRRASPALRGRCVGFLTHVAPAGKSYHVGASLPMRLAPAHLECDALGRPCGLARVHLVDSSCFTSIPATNLTLTVMANAYRIADQGTDL
jgi:choline dehydrogenase-like flavoprotein